MSDEPQPPEPTLAERLARALREWEQSAPLSPTTDRAALAGELALLPQPALEAEEFLPASGEPDFDAAPERRLPAGARIEPVSDRERIDRELSGE